MIRSLWTGTTGMSAQQLNLDVIANNLANVNTTGFKKSRADFQSLLYQKLKVPGSDTTAETESPTGIQVGLGVRPAAITKAFTQGNLILTDNELDIAIEGKGFLQAQLPDGEIAYTRAGALKRTAEGIITTSEGYPILPQIIIPEGATELNISNGGVVSVNIGNAVEPIELGAIQLATFINNGGLLAIGQNMYRESPASGAPIVGLPGENGYGSLRQLYLEGSNVNIIDEMASMITTQRAYEINSKAIVTSDEMMQTTTNLA